MLISIDELAQLQHQAAALRSGRRHSGSGRFVGPYHSHQRGSGMELEDLRPYQAGDDLRHMAWRITARSGRPTMKVFRAEQQHRVLLAIEHHPGMMFGSSGELKAAVACRCAALLAFSALAQRAEPAAVTIGSRHNYFPYSNRRDDVLAMLREINRPPPTNCTPPSVTQLLTELQSLSRRGDTIYLIGDFQRWDGSLAAALQALGRQRNLNALQIFDPGEQTLPEHGKLRLRSPYDGTESIIDCDNKRLRQRYQLLMEQKQQQLQTLLREAGVDHTLIQTDQALIPAMAGLL